METRRENPTKKKVFFLHLLKMFRMQKDGTESDVISDVACENDSLDIERTMTMFRCAKQEAINDVSVTIPGAMFNAFFMQSARVVLKHLFSISVLFVF